MIRRFLFATLVLCTAYGNVAGADDGPLTGPSSNWGSLPLTKESGTSPEILYDRAAQARRLRQQRALFQEQQRLARIEANLWMGYEPLRPSWPARPSTVSGYRSSRVLVVPYFVP